MTVEQKKVFSFNGTIFTTQKAFAAAFPAYRTYAAEVANGEATTVADLERLANERRGRRVMQTKQNAKRFTRLELGRGKGG